MDKLLYLIAPIGCAAMMGICMYLMSKGMRRDGDAAPDQDTEVAGLRAELAELRAERAEPATLDG